MKLLDIMTSPWAITPDKFFEIQDVYLRHLRGQALSSDQLAELRAAGVIRAPKPHGERERELYQVVNGVAVIPVQGVVAKRANLFMEYSGGTSTRLLGQAVAQALDDQAVHALLIDIDSPGGAVDGTQEVARQIFAARGTKPIVAYTDGMMASAAYWIGGAADHLYISGDTTEVGSIGVVATHVDYSKLEEMRGVKTTEVVAGKFKRVASAYAPLSDIGRATIQERVDHIYSVFVQDIAMFRRVSPETVIKDMADGRIFIGKQAMDHGLVDGQRSLDALIHELATGRTQGGTMSGTAGTVEAGTFTQADLDQASTVARAQGKLEGFDAGKAEGQRLGAEQERSRIKAIDDLGLKGPADMIAAAKYAEPITAEQLSMKVVKADQDLRTRLNDQFHADAPKPVPHADAPKDSATAIDAQELSVAIQAKVDEAAKQGRRLSYTDAKNQVISGRQAAKS